MRTFQIHSLLITLISVCLFLASCSEKKTQVESMCKDKAEYEKCVSNKAYFISLMKTSPIETTIDFMEKAFNEDVDQ